VERTRIERERDQLSANIQKLNEEHRGHVEALRAEQARHVESATSGSADAVRQAEAARAELARVQAEHAGKIEALAKNFQETQRQRDSLAAELEKVRVDLQKQAAQANATTPLRQEADQLKAQVAALEKRAAEAELARRNDAGAEQKAQAEISRIEAAHHNAAVALAEERKRIETFRTQVNELRREKKLELNAIAENFNNLMRERETSVAQIQQEIAQLREEMRRATEARDEAVRRAEATIANAQQSVADEVAALKRQVEEGNQRAAALAAERDRLISEKEDMMRLPAIRPMTVQPPRFGQPPNT
jgi:hypothetical protein